MLEGTALLAQVEGVDYRDLPESPTPEEFFLLSRVQGKVSVEQLCSASGLGREKTMMAIGRLVKFGLLEVLHGSRTVSNESARPVTNIQERSGRSVDRVKTSNTRVRGSRKSAAPSVADDDDDLFMPDSIAHISNLSRPTKSPESDSSSVQRGAGDVANASKTESDLDDAMNDGEADSEPIRVSSAVVVADDDDEPLFSGGEPSDTPEVQPREPDVDRGKAAVEPQPKPEKSKNPKSKRKTRPDFSKFPCAFDEFQVAQDELSEASDVDSDLKREILYVHNALDAVSHYELFGVEPDATRKEIRSSYFVLSKRYHPDLFFRKDAGEFALKAESIFKTVTKAYQVLSNKRKRQEYDQRLKEQNGLSEVGNAESDPEERRRMAAQILIQRASKRESEGDFLGAAESLKKAYSVEPSLNLAQKCATLYLKSGKRLDEAAMFAREVVKKRPDDSAGFMLLGRIYEKDRALTEALDAYEEALLNAPDDPTIQVHVERLRSQV